jgi:hypothetical protein
MVVQENEENSILPRYSRERARTMIMSIIIEHMHSIGISCTRIATFDGNKSRSP